MTDQKFIHKSLKNWRCPKCFDGFEFDYDDDDVLDYMPDNFECGDCGHSISLDDTDTLRKTLDLEEE